MQGATRPNAGCRTRTAVRTRVSISQLVLSQELFNRTRLKYSVHGARDAMVAAASLHAPHVTGSCAKALKR
jgi:hypothetical protein